MRKQLIFCHTYNTPFPEEARTETFILCWGIRDVLLQRTPAMQALGFLGFLKSMVKIGTGKRKLFAVVHEGRWVHWGWIALGFCRYYPVKKNDAVIGPIWTIPEYRGKRVATFALTKVINRLIQRGYKTLYIDTDETNDPCLKVIRLCQFGETTGSFYKP